MSPITSKLFTSLSGLRRSLHRHFPPGPETRGTLTASELRQHLSFPSPSPLLIHGLVQHWPALTQWTAANRYGNLRQLGSGKVVEVEISAKNRGYMEQDWQKLYMPLDVFFDGFLLNSEPPSTSGLTGFVAQQDLFSTIPALDQDAPCLPHAMQGGPKGEFWRRNLWIGRHTFSPIHRDPYHNLYCQVTGQKQVYLFHPDCREQLYISNRPPNTNTSVMRTPPSSASFQQYPEFSKAWLDTRTVSCIIGSGATLLIPEGWWHCVESVGDEGSISVNHWFR